tara:strand:+ start:427 stop:1698 length:1272 start_codon:yes stop_codon:yes gene_type:complete
MLDINLIRENPDLVKDNQARLNQKISAVEDVLKLDEKWRKIKQDVDNLRSKRNKISETINQAKKSGDESAAKKLIKEAKSIPDQIRVAEEKGDKVLEKRDKVLRTIPNIISKQTPKGETDKDNKEIKKVGKPTKFSFEIKNHVELCEELDLADFDASANVSGNGFYYLKNELAHLNQALIRFAIDFMKKQKYEYIEPPLMLRKKVFAEGNETFADSIYEIQNEPLALIGTAEHALLAMHSDEVFKEKDLPKKYFSYSMCFRKEIGAHGINEKGLWRTHQFNKIEQFIFCKPEDSEKLYEELLENSEGILKELELPYQVIEICTGDLAPWKYRSHDIEVYRPTTKEYGEIISLSNVTDYQARDLNIKFRRKNKNEVVHTLNNTALATSRIMVAILENNQNKDGSIDIPKALHKYTGFKKIEGKK